MQILKELSRDWLVGQRFQKARNFSFPILVGVLLFDQSRRPREHPKPTGFQAATPKELLSLRLRE